MPKVLGYIDEVQNWPDDLPELCHCGQPTIGAIDPQGEYMTESLKLQYCSDCALVRCDAYPGACMPVRQRLDEDLV